MPRQLSDVVGRLFPTTQTGSYPRPRWNGFDLGGEDIRVALRRADFAEAYTDGVRAMIGDQVGVGLLHEDVKESAAVTVGKRGELEVMMVIGKAKPCLLRCGSPAVEVGS